VKRIIPLIFFLCGNLLYAEVPFKVLRGDGATSAKKNLEMVFQTSPTAVARINSEECHVYRTGTFGSSVRLSPGPNTVYVEVIDGPDTLHRCFEVKYEKSADSADRKPEALVRDFSTVVVSKEDAWLQYGTAGDRLGASKMSCLSEGVALKVTGQTDKLYRVQLSSLRYAFIPKNQVAVGGLEPRPVNAGSITALNNGKEDVISVCLSSKLPHTCCFDAASGSLNLDLFGAYNNCNWATDKGGLKAVDFFEVQQIESDVLRLAVKLKDRRLWGYSVSYDGNNIKLSVRHSLRHGVSGRVVCLDPGHGGTQKGAISLTGEMEKDLNLFLAFRVRNLLEKKGVKVVLTREGDETLSMDERKEFALDSKADMLVSIHCNAGGTALKSLGTACYYKYSQNRELARCLYERLTAIEGLGQFGLTGNFNFTLAAMTECPSVLVETAFLSNMPDEELLLSTEGQERIAHAIASGIEDYFNTK